MTLISYQDLIPTPTGIAKTYRKGGSIWLANKEQKDQQLGVGVTTVCHHNESFAYLSDRTVFYLSSSPSALEGDVDRLFFSTEHLFFQKKSTITSTYKNCILTFNADYLVANGNSLFAAQGKTLKFFDLRICKPVGTHSEDTPIRTLALRNNSVLFANGSNKVCLWDGAHQPIEVVSYKDIWSIAWRDPILALGSFKAVAYRSSKEKNWKVLNTSIRPDPVFGGDGMLYYKQAINQIKSVKPSE